MFKIIFVLCSLSILLSPYYIFDSGLPQPNDFIASLGIVLFVFSGKFHEVSRLKIIRIVLYLIAFISLINIGYSIYFYSIGQKNTMYFVVLFYIYNALFFCLTLYIFRHKYKWSVNMLSLVIIVTLGIQVLIGLTGIKEDSRGVLFFNNPNQLGYFTLLALSIFTVLPSKYRTNKLVSLLMLGGAVYLVLLSGSRAALAGIVALGILIFIKEGFKLKVTSIIFLTLGVSFSIILINNNSFFQDKLERIKVRNERNVGKNVDEYKVRGYDRFLIYPEYIFYGSGEGHYARFKSFHQLEMHSGFGTILFSYGIIGLILFLSMLKEILKRNFFSNFLLLTPVFIYNITHMGLRDSLFWVLLASIYIVSLVEYNKLHIGSRA